MTRTQRLSLLASAGAALAVTAAMAITAVTGPGAASAAVSAAAAPKITFQDNFDGSAGSAPDGSKWGRDIGGGGFGNAEHQYYTNSTKNAALDGAGNLVITARSDDAAGYGCWYGTCKYTSARLLTANKFSQAYGRFEARIKLPRGQGIWPAFWMLGSNIGQVGWPNSGEIDIMENIGKEPSIVHGSLHGPGYSGGTAVTGNYNNGAALADAFHTFTIDWSPNTITWYLDGKAYQTKTSADTRGNPWVFDHSFFMILNLAVGGYWPGYPDGSTQFPQKMTVDYVRVWDVAGSGGGGGGEVRGLNDKCMDVRGASSANGTPVQIYDCNASTAQQWTRTGDTLRAYGKCLDISGGGVGANGAKVILWPCHGGQNQVWQLRADKTLYNPRSNRCLEVPASNTTNGTQLGIWDCNAGAKQQWRLT